MKKTVIILSVFAFIMGNCGQPLYAQFKIPTGFSEFKNPSNIRPMKRICIDFDGDGKKDTATIIEKNDSILHCYFLIYLTGSNKNHIIKMLGSVDYVHPMPLSVKKNVIQFSYGVEQTSMAFKLRYNHTKQKIQLIGYDSGGRTYLVVGGGDYKKSYNLLTGDYTVTCSYYGCYIVTNRVKGNLKEIYRGNKKMKDIFAEDINDEILDQLDSVGSEFD